MRASDGQDQVQPNLRQSQTPEIGAAWPIAEYALAARSQGFSGSQSERIEKRQHDENV